MIMKFTTIRKSVDMTTIEYVNTPKNPARTHRAIIVDLEMNVSGQYAAKTRMPGRNWQPTKNNALAVASFVLDRPVVLGKVTLVD